MIMFMMLMGNTNYSYWDCFHQLLTFGAPPCMSSGCSEPCILMVFDSDLFPGIFPGGTLMGLTDVT